ncbi:TPA: hypothetical protein DEP94_04125 [Candidatus Nomurabacteria bacterium]|nr:hypothetical protein [Candidatus Nomurabacteria bacterium]
MSPKLINILLIVSSAALYYLVIGPLWSGTGSVWTPSRGGVSNLKVQASQYKEAMDRADSIFKQGEDLKAEYELITEAEKQKMLLMVPMKIEKIHLLSEITHIADESGLALTNLSAIEINSSDKLRGSYNISFGTKTTYGTFKKFMRNYENSLRLFTIDSVKFSIPDKAEDFIDFKVTLKTYYLK